MEFYQLEAFAAVAECRSFSKAAQQLFLSQPTVSAHIKSLETSLGTPLFDRGKNELLLTTSGELLFRYAKDMLDMRVQVLFELSDKNHIREEIITLSASSVPCQYLLPNAIFAFAKKHPHVQVNLRQENSRSVCENIFHYQYALGVVGEKLSLPHLQFDPIQTDELLLVIPKTPDFQGLLTKESLSPADLQTYTLLVRERGSGTRSRFEEALQTCGFSLEEFRYLIFDNQETIKQAVRQGLGISVLSRYVVEDYVCFGFLETRPLKDIVMKRDFYLVSYDKRVQTPATRALITFLRNYFLEGEHENHLCR